MFPCLLFEVQQDVDFVSSQPWNRGTVEPWLKTKDVMAQWRW